MRALITGGAGFIGCNLADRLARDGVQAVILDSLARPGVERNLAWLRSRHGAAVELHRADIRTPAAVSAAAAGADVIFHLAAQVAVTTSLRAPVEDFDVNLRGTLNVLEAAREVGAPVIFASTNKVYGDLGAVALARSDKGYHPADPALRARGVAEDQPLDFHTPYGCSKGAADQYVLDYARSYGLPSCVLRMSCIYGPRQMGTEDQGWVAHFLIRALRDKTITVYGDGRQVRDVLFVDDAVEAYVSAWSRIGEVAGRAFNLGGGPANAVSLREVISHIETLVGRRVAVEHADWRAGDQRYFVSNMTAAREALGLAEPRPWRDGVAELAAWLGGRTARTPARAEALP